MINPNGIFFLLMLFKEEFIYSALDRNEYNHITATYFLLAERKLRAARLRTAEDVQQSHQLRIKEQQLRQV